MAPVRLPAEGRQGEAPPWPLPGDPSPAEGAAWAALWRTPQAVVWERHVWTRTLGRYCRVMVRAEQPDAQAALLAQVLALEDRLGIGPKALRMLLWEIVPDEVTPPRPRKASARERMKALRYPDVVPLKAVAPAGTTP